MGSRRGRLSVFIVSAEPWQIFLIFLAVIIAFKITPDDQGALKIITAIPISITIFGWLLILGLNLNENLPEDRQQSDALFITNGFFCILYIPLSIFLQGMALSEEMTPYLIVLFAYFGFSLFYMLYFISTLFTYNQDRLLDKEKLKTEAIFILFIISIIGIFMLQPRIKKIFL